MKKARAASMPQNNPPRASERGNIFFFILLGIMLFGALAFMISRGMRSETTSTMSQRQAELAAVDILSYAQRLERSIAKIQRRGMSENDISFENSVDTGYDRTPAQPAEHNIFEAAGGGLSWQKPPSGSNDGSDWLFTAETCIADIGSGSTGCDSDGLPNEELLAVLPNINKSLCEAIDKKLQITTIPANSGDPYSTTKFTGSFGDGGEIILDRPRPAACYKQVTDYHFYYTLIAR